MNKSNPQKERHFFLHENDRMIYCVEHAPDPKNNKERGVILCKPIWGERIRTHRIFTNLGRMLAAEGYTIITCDYFGDGNSGGETRDLSYRGMVDDILALQHYLGNTFGLQKYALIGLLVGANIAIDASSDIQNLDKMILFEPLLSPIEKIKQALRANLSGQMVLHKKILKNRDELIQDLKNDIPVNIDGFLIGKTFWESFELASPLKVKSPFTGPVTIYSMVEKGRNGTDYGDLARSFPNGRFQSIEKEIIWTDWKYFMPNPPVFFETVRSELQQQT